MCIRDSSMRLHPNDKSLLVIMNSVASYLQSSFFASLLKKPQNSRCADCKAQHSRWASFSFGVLICIRCSGFHRKLRTHVTKVRSLDLDRWTSDQLDLYATTVQLRNAQERG
eukprot:TRINITY_DN726_c0_g1_i19.p2 TRINITY_DN726_c0_g1~~TRINITY_DN726_c0_g1_i19.p2  ORF type:complete len:112 (+),score=10.55 TRINITY_DN726_c0_g1_i19:79-414(+)